MISNFIYLIKINLNISCFKYKNFMFVLLILLNTFCFNKNVVVSGATVSRCHHEGDFTVSCNKSKMPSSSSDTIEYMRYAKVINGLYHNDTLCSFVPGTSCYRKQTLNSCVDKQYCTVKNSWFSLEPDCAGNSYYTQLEYDCQPGFFMCDKETVINNVFSGLIYSPYYPNSFRSDKTEPCYLTIHLPKNHHAEITLDYFDMLKTSKCVGDYLEIQQYKETSYTNGDGRFVSKRDIKTNNNNNNKNKKENEATGDSSTNLNPLLKNNQKQPKLSNKQEQVKTARQQRKPKYKWQTLGTMCGRIDKAYTIRATADTINFKFRPLPSNHQYLTSLTNYSNKNHLGFKIYFQAIPPKAPTFDSDDDLTNIKKTITSKATTITPSTEKTNNNKNEQDTKSEKSSSNKSKIPIWLIIIIATSIALIIVTGAIVAIIITVMKRRKSQPKSQNAKNNSDSFSKSEVTTISNAKKMPNTNLKKLEKEPITEISVMRKQSHLTAKPESQPAASSSKTKIVLEPEPRKMQADRPVLLQDLSQSKLLLKFKQEANSTPKNEQKGAIEQNKVDISNQKQVENNAESNKPETKVDFKIDSNKESSKQAQTPQQAVDNSKKTSKNESVASSGQSTPSKTDPKSKNSTLSGGVYGADIYDGGGVYGADIVNVPFKPIVTSSKQSPSQSLDKTIDMKMCIDDDIKNQITKNRKTSKDTHEENENESLINVNGNKNENEYVRSSFLNMENGSNEINNFKPSSNILETPSTKVIPNVNSTRLDIIDNDSTVVSFNPTTKTQNTFNTSNLPRKPAFNPLHVILKDKNKYHTTEYI